MGDPVDGAAAMANDEDDVDDLYADLDDQVAAALATAGESGGSNARDSDPATDGEGEVPDADTNEAVDLGDGTAGYSSSDEESDDGLRIVLNEDAGAPLPPPPAGRAEGCVADDEQREDSGSRLKGPSFNSGQWGKIGGHQCKELLEKTTLPIIGQGDRGCQHAFQSDFNFFLPRNSTIFDIKIEAFQQKPWRQQSVDLTDYFNFGLDEEGWRKYWFSMKQLRQGARPLANGTLGLDQEPYKFESIKTMPKVVNYSGFEGRNGLAKPKGRAIHVEGSVCERVPSADIWRPTERDSNVVIQVNMIHSPSNQSTSDDSPTLNNKCVTTKRISIDHPVDRHLKDSRFVLDRMVDKEVHDGGSSECIGSKPPDRRESSCTRDQFSSPNCSDTLSEESKEELYFKRAHRHSDSRDFCEDSKLQDERVKSDFYCHPNKSEQENSESDSRSYTPSPADDRNYKPAKLLRRDEAPFIGRDKLSNFFMNCKSNQYLLKSGHKARKELTRQNLDGGRRAYFVVKEKSTDDYPSRYNRKYKEERSCSASLRKSLRHAVHNQLYDNQDYSHLESVALRNDEQYFSDESNHQYRRSFWRETSEGEDVVERFSSAKEWQQHRDHVYHSLLKGDVSNDTDGPMYRERYYREKVRVGHGHYLDEECLQYSDYRFSKLQSPEVSGKNRQKRCVRSNDEHLRHTGHLALYPPANDSLKTSERDWPAAGLPFISSRNKCIDNKRIHNAKMLQYHCGNHQKNKHHNSYAVAETGHCVLPAKRKLHADLGSMNHKDHTEFSFPKGRRLMHDASMASDKNRKIFAVKLPKSTKEIDTGGICSSNERNNNIVSNICVERRHEVVNADNIHLNDRKIKFERRGNELRRVVKNNKNGGAPVGKDVHSSKHKVVHQNAWKQNMGYRHSSNQDLEKLTYQSQQKEEEIEEGELIEQDHEVLSPKRKLRTRRKGLLKSVVATSSSDQLQMINAVSKDPSCSNGATKECDDRHILEVMEKMQKRRERFKEAIAPPKKDDGEQKELAAVAFSTDDIQVQRPARKRRWGGIG